MKNIQPISALNAATLFLASTLSPLLALADTYTYDVRNLPGDTYAHTCKNIKAAAAKPKATHSTVMSAECKTDAGKWQKTSINLDFCGSAVPLSNHNGQLICQPFQETCSEVSVRYEYVPVRPDAAGTGTIGPSYNRYLNAKCLKNDGSTTNIETDMSTLGGQGKSVLKNVDAVVQSECPSGKSLKPNGGGFYCK
jgi:CVNH domain